MGLARLGAADARAGSGAKRCIVGELGVQCGMRAPRNTRALAAYRHDCGDWGLVQKSGMPQRRGLDLFATSAVFQVPPVNTFGAITSNGIQGHMGNL